MAKVLKPPQFPNADELRRLTNLAKIRKVDSHIRFLIPRLRSAARKGDTAYIVSTDDWPVAAIKDFEARMQTLGYRIEVEPNKTILHWDTK